MASFRDYLREATAEQTFTSQGRAAVKTRNTNARYGDNAMSDETKLDEIDQTSTLDRLQKMLSDAGASDDEIASGVNLTRGGMQKAAAALGVGPSDIPLLLASLSTRLRHDADDLDEAYEVAIREDEETKISDLTAKIAELTAKIKNANYQELRGLLDQRSALKFQRDFHTKRDCFVNPNIREDARFSVEKDYLNNVTVRDAKSGRETYLQGSDADSLLSKLATNPSEEQRILASYRHLMEDANFDAEIKADTGGSYNFPWKYRDQHGLATVLFSEKNGKPNLELQSVRDDDGDDVEPDDAMGRDLIRQAREFIGKE